MRKALVCLSLLTALGTASAAEKLSDTTFGGFHIGVHVGEAVWNTFWVDRDAWIDNFNNDWALGTVANKYTGFNGGLQVGYDWRCPNSVYGLEADWSWIDITDNKSYSPVPRNQTVLNLRNELDRFGSLRVRAGILADNLLLYVTGGAAFSKFTHEWLVESAGDENSLEQSSISKTRWGGVAGVGGELAVYPSLTVKVEGLFFTFPEDTTSFLSMAGENQTVHFDTQNAFFVGRLGINYTFDFFG